MEIKVDGLVDVSKKVLYAGVGAVASVAEVTGKTIDKLSEKGEKVANESKVINKGKQAVKDLKENISTTKAAKNLKHALDSLESLTKEELEELKNKIEALQSEEFLNEEECCSCHGDEPEDGCTCDCHHEAEETSCCCHGDEEAHEEHCCCHEDEKN